VHTARYLGEKINEWGCSVSDVSLSGTPHLVALVKQVPRFESMTLGEDGRLVREGIALEMNPYCRRGVAKAIELAGEVGGEVTVVTMGPPGAEDCLREAIACGTDRGLLLTDRACAGSDTLATAKALQLLLEQTGPFAVIFTGKNSVDADTGQVGPELAQLMGLPFAGSVRKLDVDFEEMTFSALCETDNGTRVIEGELPAVISCGERLCAPAKAIPPLRAKVDASLIETWDISRLDPAGTQKWGAAASPTRVGETRQIEMKRSSQILQGTLETQVREAVDLLVDRGLLSASAQASDAGRETWAVPAPAAPKAPAIWALVEPERKRMTQELAQEAVRLAVRAGGRAGIVSIGEHPGQVPLGVDWVTVLEGGPTWADEDYARVLTELVQEQRPRVFLAPSTARGRAVASRVCAALGLGLTGDAVELEIENGTLVAWKPAFGGQLVAAVYSSSDVQAATVRAGVLAVDETVAAGVAEVRVLPVPALGHVRVIEQSVTDNLDTLAVAPVVIGLGASVDPDEYPLFDGLCDFLRAELVATRKVTDAGWMPHSRQIGITGRAVTPPLFLSIGASGKFNHSVGFRAAGTVLAINKDAAAPVFSVADVGIVGDWREVLPLLEGEMRSRLASVE